MPPVEVKIEPSWKEVLQPEFSKPYFLALTEFIKKEKQAHKIYPPGSRIFHAFNVCPFDKVKVVILGQDPYYGIGQAHGLSFSVAEGVPTPRSLQNIFKEIQSDIGKPIPHSGNLERWATQGVLLLNSMLTVRAGAPASHQGKGWETFTDCVIKTISSKKNGIVFILWGGFAQKKASIINPTRHYILKSAHPSPLSARNGFFGSRHFSKTNQYLKSINKEEIIW